MNRPRPTTIDGWCGWARELAAGQGHELGSFQEYKGPVEFGYRLFTAHCTKPGCVFKEVSVRVGPTVEKPITGAAVERHYGCIN